MSPICGKLYKGIAPDVVNTPLQYVSGVRAYAVLLNVHFNLPFKKITNNYVKKKTVISYVT